MVKARGSVVVKELDIVEFRGIRRFSEPLRLRKFNVVIGRNNSGKTAILEALYLLAYPWSDRFDALLGKPRIGVVAELHSEMSSLVYGYSGSAKLRYRIGSAKVEIEIGVNGVSKASFNDVDRVHDSYIKELASILRASEEEISRLTFFVPNSDALLRTLMKTIASSDVWNAIVKQGIHRRVVRELVDPLVYDRFTEVLIERGRLKLRKEVSEDIGPLYIDVADLGDGVERLCLVALALEYLRPRLVLWDDIEASAHPGMIETVLRWLSSRDWQVVIATHSLDVLMELLRVWPKDCGVIVLRKTRDDVVEHRVLELEELERLLSSGIDVRKVVDELEL